jgi:hypothetical protein
MKAETTAGGSGLAKLTIPTDAVSLLRATDNSVVSGAPPAARIAIIAVSDIPGVTRAAQPWGNCSVPCKTATLNEAPSLLAGCDPQATTQLQLMARIRRPRSLIFTATIHSTTRFCTRGPRR